MRGSPPRRIVVLWGRATDVDGVKIPFTARVSSVMLVNSQTLTIVEVKHSVTVEDTIFDMPKQ